MSATLAASADACVGAGALWPRGKPPVCVLVCVACAAAAAAAAGDLAVEVRRNFEAQRHVTDLQVCVSVCVCVCVCVC